MKTKFKAGDSLLDEACINKVRVITGISYRVEHKKLMTKPKFKVGDRLINKKDPSFVIHITKSDKDKYINFSLFKGDIFQCNVYLPLDYIEKDYTLDINHHIKSL